MVIHEDEHSPMEVPTRRRSQRSEYVVVQNHVREIRVGNETPADTSQEPPAHRRKRKIHAKPIRNESEDETKDLEELRRVYFECKRVLASIELKYGGKLNLLTEECTLDAPDRNDSPACTCAKNKRLVFDESGVEREQPASGEHVCVTRSAKARCKVQVEREDACRLPDSVPQLALLLRDVRLGAELRRAAVERMRALRVELNDRLRYERPALVEQAKRDPDAALAFVGTNLSSLPGYHH